MALGTLGDLRTKALKVRTDLVPDFADFITLAEQRMYYGGDGVPPLRIRELESTSDLAFTAGVGALPDGFLDKRALYWGGQPTVSVSFEPPSVFYPMSTCRAGGSYPLAYTIEGNTIKVSPALTGTAKLLHYTKAAALEDDADTNDILENFPGVYLYGVEVEIYRTTRNAEQALNALRRYADAVDAANRYTMVSRSLGGPLKRRVGFAGV